MSQELDVAMSRFLGFSPNKYKLEQPHCWEYDNGVVPKYSSMIDRAFSVVDEIYIRNKAISFILKRDTWRYKSGMWHAKFYKFNHSNNKTKICGQAYGYTEAEAIIRAAMLVMVKNEA